MPWQQRVYQYIGSPVGISLINGQGTSGVLCDIRGNILYVVEYLYQSQFALKQYPSHMIANINPFPNCPDHRPPLY